MSATSWKDHFGSRITGYDPIEAQGLSELGYGLKHNQISQDEYLSWARSTFELCSIDVKFFQSHSPPRELFERLKDVYAWGPECLPVAEWDEHVIIAGLEKPQDLPAELKPIFLLAPLEGLENYWNHYQSENAEAISSEEAPVENSGVPDGLSLQDSATATNLNFSGISLAIPEVTKTQADSQKPHSTPSIPSSKPTEAEAVEKTTAPAQKNPATAVSLKPHDEESVAIKIADADEPIVPKKAPPSISIPTEDLDDIKATPIVLSSENEIVTQPRINMEPEPVKAQPKIVAKKATSKVPVNEAQVQEALASYKDIYEKRVYIEFNSDTKTAIAVFWPQDFVATEGPSAHSLEQDSFLSIVFKTQKPYHGYVVKSVVAETFFKELNYGVKPENLTVVPLLMNGEVIGALAGWGPKTTYTLNTLKQIEKAAETLSEKLGWVTTEAA